ncbi:GntR family transcriptional regulator [Bordetella ansorpii]|uniref:GntR family transcriptional regulator n=1 Tax=Bordetella ansorpii TaxID=288768 RepID=A0A157S7D5_9BORD|nr:PLP-dependent aminotransferase family protein [Bordetella ansorpii]SAI66153.1 GntR family transcriptional regulator [Bordetella ansorpii]
MISLPFGGLPPLDPGGAEPLYRQIYARFRHAIASGLLESGQRLPSARALAAELGLARGTIETAYGLLSAEGYILARGQAGTVVAPDLRARAPVAAEPSASAPVPAAQGLPLALESAPGVIPPFQMGVPALDAFPRKIWARLGARAVRAMQAGDMVYPPLAGLPALRTAIAAYLQVARGIACAPHQVFVTGGYRHTLDLIARTLFQAGDRVWVEDPCFPPTLDVLRQGGLRAHAVPVDADGMNVARGIETAPRARGVVVTPAHQSPLSVSLSLPRRQALLDWAARESAWVVEDDYDGEYRYVSRPLPALKSLDRDGRVLYAGTFSKVLFPALRLAYLVVPQAEAARFEQVSRAVTGGSPALTQETVAAFIEQGHFARHIQRMRKLYGERRQIAAQALEQVLQPRARIESQPGGMHLILRLGKGIADRELAVRLREQGMYANALSDWAIESPVEPGLLLGFTNIATREEAQRLGRRIAALM